jgi:XTP/dITP diphosphohydrolase
VHFHCVKLVFASTNPHKVREVREILAELAPLGIEVMGLHEVGPALPAPDENAVTFAGNARIKAVAYARALGCHCLADDSGLEVDALGGAPGVRSARYAGTGSTREERDRSNRERLVAEIRTLGDVNRAARLVCTLCLADAEGRALFESSGVLEGVIRDEARGGSGFGYDALLYLPDDRTVAELSPEELNGRSHRAHAVRALHSWLMQNPLSPP